MSLAYAMEPLSREEMAASDPFGGDGVFLPAPGVTSAEMLARLEVVAGAGVPAVAWDQIGLWAAPGSGDVTVPELESVWRDPDG